jgi:hypothetical protein
MIKILNILSNISYDVLNHLKNINLKFNFCLFFLHVNVKFIFRWFKT